MHFLPYFSSIDVLSLLHSFVFALHISHSSSPPTLLGFGWLRKNANPTREAEYPLSCCRPVISSRTLPSHVTPTLTHKHHPPSLDVRSPFVLFIRFVLYIVDVLLYHYHFAAHLFGVAMRGQVPPGYLALSLCTSFDIDVLLFATELVLD